MKCASALSTLRNTEAATAEVLERVKAGLSGDPADLAFLFVSPHHAEDLGKIGRKVIDAGLAQHTIGCSGESIIGDGQEVEGSSALSLWTISLPETSLTPVRLEQGTSGFRGWEPDWDRPTPDARTLFLMGDPFRFPMDDFFKSLAKSSPGLKVCGGMASGGTTPGQIRIMLDGVAFAEGAVGMLVDGPARISPIVSQGCRPIGRHLIVTSAEQNVIRELGRRPAVDVLREIYESLSEEEQSKVRDGLHLGIVINEYQDTFERGDFLVRNVLGTDQAGGIAITDLARVGQTVQFHIRDAETAHEDLVSLLSRDRGDAQAAGVLVFSCNGRGTRLFGEPDHDATAITQAFGPIPTAGFFAMGELGPVGGRNFVHGFTASVVLFEES